jgi:hypothetical protein
MHALSKIWLVCARHRSVLFGVVFDGTLLPGGATGNSSAPAARTTVVAARLHAIAANALIIIGLIDGGAGEQRRRKLEADRFGVL